MKILTALSSVAVLVSAFAAFAAPQPQEILCHSTGVADAGFDLRVSRDERSAGLSEISFSGTRPIARLACRKLVNPPPHPDEMQNFLLCSGSAARYGSLAVRVYSPGIAGRMMASVRQVVRRGFRRFERELKFGRLLCEASR